jgi:hypothetical protein
VLIWLNGTFGVGKTQAAHELQRRLPGSIVSDPELPGLGIQRMYPPHLRVDFQTTPWWAPVVTEVLADLSARHPGHVIVPMTLADDERHTQIMAGLRDAGCDIHQVTLLAQRDVVLRRLRSRLDSPRSWSARQYDSVTPVLRGPQYAPQLDTTSRSISAVADDIGRIVGVELLPADHNPVRAAARRLRVQLSHLRPG